MAPTPAMIEEGTESQNDEVGFAARLKRRLSEENRSHIVKLTVGDANVRRPILSDGPGTKTDAFC